MVFVLPVSKQQSTNAAQVLAQAFANDPFVSSLVPNDRPGARLQALFTHLIKRKYLNKECIDIAFDSPTKQVVGVALWQQPKSSAENWWLELLHLGHYLRIFGKNTLNVARIDSTITKNRPVGNYWYLESIGVLEQYQRQGIGQKLLNHRLALIDKQNSGAYLEASTLKNVDYYQKFDFIPREKIVTHTGPQVTAMWRPEKTSR